jgi:hypothetical protein
MSRLARRANAADPDELTVWSEAVVESYLQ